MENTLFLPRIVQWNRDSIKNANGYEDILFNTRRVQSWFQNDDGYTQFYYLGLGQRRVYPIELISSYVPSVFEQYFEETETRKYISLNIDTYYSPNCWVNNSEPHWEVWKPTKTKINIVLEHFIMAKARPSSETGSWVWVEAGNAHAVCYKVEDTLDEINSTASNSGSLPAS